MTSAPTPPARMTSAWRSCWAASGASSSANENDGAGARAASVVSLSSGARPLPRTTTPARAALDGQIPALRDFTFAQLDIPQILTAVVLGKIGTAAVTDTLVQVSRLPKTVLIVDDLHLLSGQPGATPLINDMTACFRPLLASGGLRAIFTTIAKEDETKLASD